MVGWIEKKRKRYFERFSHLEFVEGKRETWFDYADHGGNAKARTGLINVKRPDDFYATFWQSDFFMCLAKGCLNWSCIGLFDSPTGKTDLAGVIIQVISPASQKDGLSLKVFNNGNKNGSGAQRTLIAIALMLVRVHGIVAGQRFERRYPRHVAKPLT